MVEAKCLNCGKVVQLDDKFTGKTVKCPACGISVLVGGLGNLRLDKSALRQELARLSAAPESGRADKPAKSSAPPEPAAG